MASGARRSGSDAALLRLLGVQALGWVLVGASLYVRARVGPQRWGWQAVAVVGLLVAGAAFVGAFRVRIRQVRGRSRGRMR